MLLQLVVPLLKTQAGSFLGLVIIVLSINSVFKVSSPCRVKKCVELAGHLEIHFKIAPRSVQVQDSRTSSSEASSTRYEVCKEACWHGGVQISCTASQLMNPQFTQPLP